MPSWTELRLLLMPGLNIDHIHWYRPQYTPSIQQQGLLSKQIISKTPKELRYIERSVFLKEENNKKLWNFEIGSKEGLNFPIWFVIGLNNKIDKTRKI